ncbi:hypothetical protein RHECNPAF_4310043 [Rhizobium etli CNPAF512]|nr:hypothetical protein RHECNPAF_4310043 [Rhizobium etli CNPAF512]
MQCRRRHGGRYPDNSACSLSNFPEAFAEPMRNSVIDLLCVSNKNLKGGRIRRVLIIPNGTGGLCRTGGRSMILPVQHEIAGSISPLNRTRKVLSSGWSEGAGQ